MIQDVKDDHIQAPNVGHIYLQYQTLYVCQINSDFYVTLKSSTPGGPTLRLVLVPINMLSLYICQINLDR